jgi:nucleoside-diphosphate-sugar epimerase
MRILVAGDRGYIGAVMVPFLRGAGHQVDGLDAGLYEGVTSEPRQRASAGGRRATSGTPKRASWPTTMR